MYEYSVSILALGEADLFGGYVDLLGVLLLFLYLCLQPERWVEVVGVVVGCEAGGADVKKLPKAPKKKQESTMSQAGYPTRLSGL